MADLVLKHVDAIAVDAASETALNGVVQKACRAGIKVIAFDSILSAPCRHPRQDAQLRLQDLSGRSADA